MAYGSLNDDVIDDARDLAWRHDRLWSR